MKNCKWKKIVGEIIFIIAPTAISAAVFNLIKNFSLYPYISILGSVVSLLLIASLFLHMNVKGLVLVRAAGVGLLYLFWLKNTPFNFEGMFGDNHYYTLAVEKFYYSFLPYSHEYQNIHFSLPPLFFFLIGRIGALLKAPLPAVLKYSSYLFVIYLPYVWGYFLGGIFKKDKWLAAFVLSLLVAFKTPLPEYSSLAYLAQKGWHFLDMFLILIWYLWVRRERPHFLKAGLTAGILLALDFSPFLFLFAAIVYELAERFVGDLRTHPKVKRAWAEFFTQLSYYARLGMVALVVNLPWVVPIARDMLTHRLATSFNSFFSYTEGHASIFQSLFLFDPFDIFSIVLIVGLVNLFLNVSRHGEVDSLRRIFFGLIAFALVFYALAFAGLPIPMQHFSLFALHVMALAAVFVAWHFRTHRLLPLVLSLLVIASVFQLNDNRQNQYALDRAIHSTAIYRRGEALRRRYDFRDQVIFPTTNELFFGKKTYSFITADFFSDAAASFEDRLAYIQAIYPHASAGRTEEFHRALKQTPYGSIQYVILEKGKGGELFFSVNAYHNDLKEFRSKRRFFRFTDADFPQKFFLEIYQDDEFKVFKLK